MRKRFLAILFGIFLIFLGVNGLLDVWDYSISYGIGDSIIQILFDSYLAIGLLLFIVGGIFAFTSTDIEAGFRVKDIRYTSLGISTIILGLAYLLSVMKGFSYAYEIPSFFIWGNVVSIILGGLYLFVKPKLVNPILKR